MKKMLLALLLTLSIASVADAKIAENRIAIGGLYPGQTVSQVEAIYGKPARVSGDAKTPYYFYNQSNDTEFEVCFRNGVVSHIRISGNNGIETADGIKIGSTKDDVLNTYGQPDSLIQGGGFKTHPDSQFFRYFPTSDKKIYLNFEVRYGKVLYANVETYVERS